MIFIIAKISGVIGLLLITYGIFIKKEKQRDKEFALGGAFLLVYSIYLQDLIFIVLQTVFIIANLYEIHKIKKTSKHLNK